MMKKNENNVNKRVRRTNRDIEKSIMDATKEMLEEYGFFRISITELAEKANTELPVIYRWYDNLEGLLTHYIQNYDYWFADLIDDIPNKTSLEKRDILKSILKDVIKKLYNDKSLRRILAWEIADDSLSSIKSLKTKETTYSDFILPEYLSLSQKNIKHVDAIMALITGGIYYIALTKHKSSFWGINFNSRSGKQKLFETIDLICDWIFSLNSQQDSQILMVARKLKENKVDQQIIADSTGLSLELINNL